MVSPLRGRCAVPAGANVKLVVRVRIADGGRVLNASRSATRREGRRTDRPQAVALEPIALTVAQRSLVGSGRSFRCLSHGGLLAVQSLYFRVTRRQFATAAARLVAP